MAFQAMALSKSIASQPKPLFQAAHETIPSTIGSCRADKVSHHRYSNFLRGRHKEPFKNVIKLTVPGPRSAQKAYYLDLSHEILSPVHL
jgi:hypothetical protein